MPLGLFLRGVKCPRGKKRATSPSENLQFNERPGVCAHSYFNLSFLNNYSRPFSLH